MQQNVIKLISLEKATAIIEQSTEQQSVDTGASFVSTYIHPTFGTITLVTSAFDAQCAAIFPQEHAEKLAA